MKRQSVHGSIEKILDKADDLFVHGQFNQALKLYEDVLKANQTNTDALYGKAQCLKRLGNLEGSFETYVRLGQIVQGDPCIYFNAAQILKAMGKESEVNSFIEKATEAKPIDAEGFRCQANAFDELGNAEKALAAYDESITLDPDMAMTYYDKGIALSNLGKHKEALWCNEKAIQLDPDFSQAYLQKADYLTELKRYDEAIDSYDMALRLDPFSARAYMDKGWVFEKLKKFSEAIECYDRAIALSKDEKDQENLALLWFNKGNALYALDKLDEAIAAYQEAFNVGGPDPDVFINLGLIYEALGHYKEALGCLRNAIDIEPSADVDKKVKELELFINKRTEQNDLKNAKQGESGNASQI